MFEQTSRKCLSGRFALFSWPSAVSIHQRILISIDQTHNIIIVIGKSIPVFVGITVLCDRFQFARCVLWLFHCSWLNDNLFIKTQELEVLA